MILGKGENLSKEIYKCSVSFALNFNKLYKNARFKRKSYYEEHILNRGT